jgi:hypothetical protein
VASIEPSTIVAANARASTPRTHRFSSHPDDARLDTCASFRRAMLARCRAPPGTGMRARLVDARMLEIVCGSASRSIGS